MRVGRLTIRYTPNWRSKTHPYWFARRYPKGYGWTIQVMGLDVWGR